MVIRKQIITALLICIMTGCLFGCSSKETANEPNGGEQFGIEQNNNAQNSRKKHSIEVTDDKGIISKCPKSAKAGDIVTLKTNCFMDAIPQINVNGNDVGEWDANRTKYTFIMPDEDVKITTRLKSSGGV